MPPNWIPIAKPGPTVTESDVLRFEIGIVSCRLPDDYRRFLLEVNGGRAPSSHRVFTIRRGEVKNETVLHSLYSLNAPDDRDDLATAQVHHDPLMKPPKGFMWIGYDDFGSPLIMPLVSEHRGEIWYFDIEDGLEDRTWIGWFERRDVWHVANSFAEFMAGLRSDDSAAACADDTREEP